MSRPPGMTPPPPDPHQPAGPGPVHAPPPVKGVDEVAAAKARLLTATEPAAPTADPTAKVQDFLRDHPYIAAGAALGAGLLVARVATLRKMATVGGMWFGKRYLMRYLRQMSK